ncbi:MAG: ABC transporter permease [Rhodobacteraceae bacterium]|nr:ABC transporter permease [Paracoccaceae bacterium]
MTFLVQLLAWLVAMFIAAWVFRFAGQRVPWKQEALYVYFRDMNYMVAFGFVLAFVALYWSVILYFFREVTFFMWAVNGLIFFSISGFLFRLLGRRVGTELSRKIFRDMPITAAFGILTILVYAVLAIFADLIAPYGQAEVFDSINVLPGGNPELGGNPNFLLGTDQLGRDLLSRLIYGAQNTVGIAFVTTCLAFLIGATFGFLAAALGGWVDQITSRVVDALMAIPQLIFALLLMTIATAWAGSDKALIMVYMVVIIAFLDSTRVYRLARAVGLNIVVMDYIEAARIRGENLTYLIFREILPNATAPLLAEFGLRFCFVFLTIAALSFLGIGIQPPLADWGTMVRDLSQFINFAAFSPLTAALPLMAAGAIALLTVAVNFVVDWMLHKSSGLKE